MKRIVALGAALLTAGCLSAPDDTASFRNMTATHPMLTTKAFTVSRSLGAVNNSLAAGAKKCFQRVSANSYSNGYGYGTSTVVMKYQYSMKRTATGVELGLHRKHVNAGPINFDKDGGYVYLVDTRAAGGGTKVTLYTGKMGYKELDAAMYGWASGEHLYCPQM